MTTILCLRNLLPIYIMMFCFGLSKATDQSCNDDLTRPVECYECVSPGPLNLQFCSDPFNRTHAGLRTAICHGPCVKWIKKLSNGLVRYVRTCSLRLQLKITLALVCMKESPPEDGQLCLCHRDRCNMMSATIHRDTSNRMVSLLLTFVITTFLYEFLSRSTEVEDIGTHAMATPRSTIIHCATNNSIMNISSSECTKDTSCLSNTSTQVHSHNISICVKVTCIIIDNRSKTSISTGNFSSRRRKRRNADRAGNDDSIVTADESCNAIESATEPFRISSIDLGTNRAVCISILTPEKLTCTYIHNKCCQQSDRDEQQKVTIDETVRLTSLGITEKQAVKFRVLTNRPFSPTT